MRVLGVSVSNDLFFRKDLNDLVYRHFLPGFTPESVPQSLVRNLDLQVTDEPVGEKVTLHDGAQNVRRRDRKQHREGQSVRPPRVL